MEKNRPGKELFMKRCFHLARMPLHNVAPNPRVGAVLVHDDKIIGEGFHRSYGTSHAEVNAVNSVSTANRKFIPESTMYISLEPCFHHGKTPPCVDLLLREKIPRVIISCRDPNPKVNGKSIAKLRENGVTVVEQVLSTFGEDLIKPFSFAQSKKRPYIVLKYALSKDGFLGHEGKQVWLSNSYTKRLVHKWRSKANAILCGANTVRIDNPRLTTRYYYGDSPLRIIMSRSGNLPEKAHVFDKSASTIILSKKRPDFISPGMPGLQWYKYEGNVASFSEFLSLLVKKGIHSMIVEGGGAVLEFFTKNNLWDEARILETGILLKKGIPAPFLTGNKTHMQKVDNNRIIVYKP